MGQFKVLNCIGKRSCFNQCSGSTGSVSCWACRIRIRNICTDPDPCINRQKNTLISPVLWFFNDLLFLKKAQRKQWAKELIFCCYPENHWRKEQDLEPNPDPVHWFQHITRKWFNMLNSVSLPWRAKSCYFLVISTTGPDTSVWKSDHCLSWCK